MDIDLKKDKNTLVEEGVITELSDEENKWWTEKAVKPFRTRLVKEAIHYVELAIAELKISKENVSDDVSGSIKKIRETAWGHYIKDEVKFHNEILTYLTKTRDIPANILNELTELNFMEISSSKDALAELKQKLPSLVGDFTGRIMPYVYSLTLSTTNSRRMRSGQTFEIIISKIFELFNIPYQDQSMLGRKFFADNNVSKKVDFIVPSKERFLESRQKTMIVSTKTSLRERWQQVVEELDRTGNSAIYLLTVDESLSSNIATILNQYNIVLVVYDEMKIVKFAEATNIKGYSEFFHREVPHILQYWSSNT